MSFRAIQDVVDELAHQMPTEVVRRYHAAGRWDDYRSELLEEVRRTLPSEGGRGKNASAIFGNPPWARRSLKRA